MGSPAMCRLRYENNISVKQADVQARIAEIQVLQAETKQVADSRLRRNIGLQFGRSIDPTTTFIPTRNCCITSTSCRARHRFIVSEGIKPSELCRI